MYTKVLSIDQQILTEMITTNAILLSIYEHAIHIVVAEKIITVGHKIGHGKHHILIDDDIDFRRLDLYVEAPVLCTENQMVIGKLVLIIEGTSVKEFSPYDQTYLVNQKVLTVIDRLKLYMKDNHSATIYNYNRDNFIENYQFSHIKYFLDNPSYDTAKMILGLGDGLTPLGDDILVGYMTGLNAVGKTFDWLHQIVNDAKKSTTRFSSQNLFDASQKYYSSHYIDMIQGILENHSLEMIKPVLSIGHTSGAGIVTGFIHAILQGE